MKTRKTLVGKATFKSRHRLEVEALIEYVDNTYPRDIVFITIHKEMKTDNANTVRMQIEGNDLRAMIEGTREIIAVPMREEGKFRSSFKKLTKSQNLTTTLTFGQVKKKDANDNDKLVSTFYLNMTRGQETTSMSFDKYSIRAFEKRLAFLAERLDLSLFAAQSALHKLKAENKEQT